MKTVATLTLLAGGLIYSADSADAQCYIRPAYSPIVIHEPPYTTTRPVVTQPVATYGGFSHIDDLAVEMEQQARDILWEMHVHYSRNPGFDVTYAEAYEIFRYAKYIHAQVHHGNRAEIARVVRELDQLFHHVEDDIRTWRPSHRHFVAHGNLFDKMEAMEDTLHHLMEDVGVTAQSADPPLPNSNPPLPTVSLSRF